MAVTARDGEILSERWGEHPTAYLGVTIPKYPNFFCMYGPGTSLAHGGFFTPSAKCVIPPRVWSFLSRAVTGRWSLPRTRPPTGTNRLA